MARTSAKAKKQRQEATKNRDKGEEPADSLPPDNQENIENGAQKEKPNRRTIIKGEQEEEQEDGDYESDVSESEKKGKKRGKVENSKRKEKKVKREKSVSEDDEEDETPKNDFDNDVSDSEKKGKKKGKVEHSKRKEKKLKREKSDSEDEEDTSTANYEVEKIVEVYHKKNGKREFLIRWKGFSSKDDTWEPEEHLSCPELIDRFMAKVDKAKKLSVRELRDQRPRTQRFTPTVPGVRTSHRNQGKARTVFYAE